MGGNLKEIRKQITSVKNTQKTTKAMKLVSSSKLKKAEELARRSKLYANQLNAMFDDVVAKIRARGLDSINSRYFAKSSEREIKKLDIIFITADKGLCGGFNTTTIKEVVRIMESYKQQGVKVRLRGVGKKGISFFAFNDIEVLDKAVGLSAMPSFEKAAEFIDKVVEDFLSGATDEVMIVHNGFKNMISQELESRAILPLTINATQSEGAILNIEPEDEEDQILDELAKKYIQYNMYYALVDSLAAEHSARIQAMDAATNNAGDLVKSLTISLNKARQEAITTELVEINAGVEAIK